MAARPVVDSFIGTAGVPPWPRLWCYNTGSGWTGEAQTYTSSTDNVSLDGNGHLAITARRAPDGSYTSGRIKTEGSLTMGYGRVEATILMPPGPGLLPAFWLLGSNYPTVGGLAAGEIDIIECVRGTIQHTIHGPGADGADYNDGAGVNVWKVPVIDPTSRFRTYWAERSKDKIVIGVDTTTTATFTPASLPPGGQWVFNDQPMFAILNLAVGDVGNSWVGAPDPSTPFPQTMLVDSFRFTPS